MNKNDSNTDSIVKNAGAVLLGIIVLALVYNVFFSPGQMYMGYGGGMNFADNGMHMGNSGYGMAGQGFGISLGGILAGILIILVKLLSILLVAGLVIGIWMVAKDYLLSDGENPLASLTKGFTGTKMNCPKCGSSVDTKWDFCPDCGQPLSKENKPPENNQPNQG